MNGGARANRYSGKSSVGAESRSGKRPLDKSPFEKIVILMGIHSRGLAYSVTRWAIKV